MQRLIILLAAALLALTLACKAAGGLSNALQNEMGESGEAVRDAAAETPSIGNAIRGNAPTPDPTIAAAIASINDIGSPEVCRKVRDRMEAIQERWPYMPNGSKIPGEWVDAGAILQEFIRNETQAREDWGNRCLRVQIPDWPDDKTRSNRAVTGIYPGVGRVVLRDVPFTASEIAVYRNSRGFCEFSDWKPAAGGEMPVLTFENCRYDETWD